MKELGDDFKEPTFLLKMGFACKEEDSTDNHRMVRFSRNFQSDKSPFKFIVLLEYELSIRDDPSFDAENFSYEFEGAYLLVVDRHMEEDDYHGEIYYDEDSEKPNFIGKTKLNIQTRSELRSFIKALS